jgi:hypothetical protein
MFVAVRLRFNVTAAPGFDAAEDNASETAWAEHRPAAANAARTTKLFKTRLVHDGRTSRIVIDSLWVVFGGTGAFLDNKRLRRRTFKSA